MGDFLNVIVEGDLLATFVRLFEVVLAMDTLCLVARTFANAGDAVS